MHFLKRKIRMRKISFLKSKEEEEIPHLHIKGAALLEDLIATFGARYKIPIRQFSAQEILSATNQFGEETLDISDGSMYLGSLERRPVLVKKYTSNTFDNIRDIAVNSQMSHHKNVLKLVGCCLEFEYPALVYDFSGNELLSDRLFGPFRSTLSWSNRLRIANEVASVIAYLHEAFPTPIIFRNIKPTKVIIDLHGVAKLFDFSLSISLPRGEEQVEDDRVCGTWGYLDPLYAVKGIVTQKTDVYSFGKLLLNILTGRKAIDDIGEEVIDLVDRVIDHIGKDELEQIVDPEILEEDRGVEKMQQIHAFLHLALRCIVLEVQDEPFMLDVAKQLHKIERYPDQLPSLESIRNSIKSYSLGNFVCDSAPNPDWLLGGDSDDGISY